MRDPSPLSREEWDRWRRSARSAGLMSSGTRNGLWTARRRAVGETDERRTGRPADPPWPTRSTPCHDLSKVARSTGTSRRPAAEGVGFELPGAQTLQVTISLIKSQSHP